MQVDADVLDRMHAAEAPSDAPQAEDPASAGRLQLGEGSGYEGLFGIATKVSKARVFVEARWSEMSQQDRLDSGYEYNNVRIGISHEFSGL